MSYTMTSNQKCHLLHQHIAHLSQINLGGAATASGMTEQLLELADGTPVTATMGNGGLTPSVPGAVEEWGGSAADPAGRVDPRPETAEDPAEAAVPGGGSRQGGQRATGRRGWCGGSGARRRWRPQATWDPGRGHGQWRDGAARWRGNCKDHRGVRP